MTTTTNMGWALSTVGASSDTWGDELNAIFTNQDSQMPGLIYGLTISAAGSTATFGIAAGAANGMVLASAYTKTTSAWGVGTGQGALDTGAIANSTWYHVWLIQRTDTSVVDVLVSTSASSPTMPTNYTRKRRIGSMKTDGSAQWLKFSQNGDEFLWDVSVQDATSVTPGVTTATTVTLTVPSGVKTNALGSVAVQDGTSNVAVNISSLDVSDQGPSFSGMITAYGGGTPVGVPFSVRTNTSAQVRLRVSSTTASYSLNTRGWIDARGR